MAKLLIRNAKLVTDGQVIEGDVRVSEGRIERIGGQLSGQPGEQEFDAAGRVLLPGMIDDQVHFREPGMEHKGDIATESAAAVAGGITSYLEMPNTRPPALDSAAVEDKYRRAQGRSRANFGFYIGASNDNLHALIAADPALMPGVKVFMGASTGNMLVDDPAILEAIFRDVRLPIITHCEDTPTIEAALAHERALHGDDIPVQRHPFIRSREACLRSTGLAIDLARRHDARLHVLHISTAEETELFAPGPIQGKRITAETCVHFLQFDSRDYAERGNLIKCNPAIKEPADREALIAALADDRLDVLATDHAPHTLEEKSLPYTQAPSGLPLVQFALVAALELYHDGAMQLPHLVHKIAHAPAMLFDVRERGFLREGYWADLVLVDLTRETLVRREDVLSRCGWSPFEGRSFRSAVCATWVNGELAWDGQRLTETVAGRRLEFAR